MASTVRAESDDTAPERRSLHSPASALWGQLIPALPTAVPLNLWTGQQAYTIGRHHSCNFRFPDPAISNIHCTISWHPTEPAEVSVEDNSTNGTFINGTKIARAHRLRLRQGDELRLSVSERTGHRYIYQHLGTRDGSSIFDEYTLQSALDDSDLRNSHWSAIRIADGKPCRVKVIRMFHEGISSIPWIQQQATRLAQAPAHPNVLQYLAVFKAYNGIHLATDSASEDLLELILNDRLNGMEENSVRALTRDICAGLAFLHERSIFPAALVPESVFIVDGRAKIDVALVNVALGNPGDCLRGDEDLEFIAPEVYICGATVPSGAQNMWSCGKLVSLMLTGSLERTEVDDGTGDRDAKLRERPLIDWDAVRNKAPNAQEWLQGALQRDSALRMDARAALAHTWLRESPVSPEQVDS
ncbi:hypothetical protein AURDEDRAFT_182934 [Auricularia subglabra TFB-10046 SS5]|nr:hypothetical protein AURDEDRAFT_182934 [Auricularia subglabra TFB-10046 SS5]